MGAPVAKSAYGTQLKVGDGASPQNFATVAEVKKLKIGVKLNTKDVTSHSSANAWVEKIPTLLEGDGVKATLNWLPGHATQSYSTGLLKDMVNRTARDFQIVIPAASNVTWSFTAYVAKFEGALDVDDVQELDIELELTGAMSLA